MRHWFLWTLVVGLMLDVLATAWGISGRFYPLYLIGKFAVMFIVIAKIPWHDPPPGWALSAWLSFRIWPWKSRKAWYQARKYGQLTYIAIPINYFYETCRPFPELHKPVTVEDGTNVTFRAVVSNSWWAIFLCTVVDPPNKRGGGNARKRSRRRVYDRAPGGLVEGLG